LSIDNLHSYLDLVFDIAGYYPFFIQIACAALFEHLKNRPTSGKAFIDRVKEDFLDEAKVHFQQSGKL